MLSWRAVFNQRSNFSSAPELRCGIQAGTNLEVVQVDAKRGGPLVARCASARVHPRSCSCHALGEKPFTSALSERGYATAEARSEGWLVQAMRSRGSWSAGRRANGQC